MCCGHGTIAICTVLVEKSMIEVQQPETEIVLDTLAGLVRAKVAVMAVQHAKGGIGLE
jgi:proline racemase